MQLTRLTGILLALTVIPASAHAVAVFLTGANLYAANPATGAATTLDYQHSTNSEPNGGHAFLPIDLAGDALGAVSSGISFELSLGDNVFTYREGAAFSPFLFEMPAYGLNLFFNDTGVSFNPARGAPGIAGDLTVAVADGSSAFFVPVAGTQVQSYTSKNSLPKNQVFASANGDLTTIVGGYDVTVTAFFENGGNQSPQGSFTINVAERAAPVPEPATLALLAVALSALGFNGRKRSTRA